MRLILSLIILLTFIEAASKQVYFIGKYGRLGSISAEGANKKGVFLRWDMIEGNMPSEIAKIELIKEVNDNNTTLLSVNSNALMSESEIRKVFQKPYNTRSLYEIIESLSKNEDGNCSEANLNNYPQKIKSCLVHNKMWSFLASRVNFNIAQVRYRAYLDENVSANQTITYYLLAKNSDGSKVKKLGEITIDTSQTKGVFGAKNLEQIITSKCNDNRYALDDFRVALKWENGGNSSEKFINNLMVAGYDVYYSTKVVSKLPNNYKNLDIASLAKNKNSNSKGEVDLSSSFIKKANETLITIGSQKGKENEPLYLETQKELKARGFLPGEKRYYYIVPRDFSGNYGPTKVIEVTIPDLLPPEKPIEVYAAENNVSIDLIWRKPTLKSYSEHYKFDMKLCLAQSLVKANRYRFVEVEKSCSEDEGIDVNFNIDKFYVYRFDNFDEAAAFNDKDLDGYDDDFEKSSNTDSCDAKSYPNSQQKNHLVAIIDAKSINGEVVRFQDRKVNNSKVYWYRIASVTSSGISSYLTAPTRALVPKRGLKDVPDFDIGVYYYKVSLNGPDPVVVTVDNSVKKDITRVAIDIKGNRYDLVKNGHDFNLPDYLRGVEFNGNEKFELHYYIENEKVFNKEFNVADIFDLSRGNNEGGYIQRIKKQIILLEDLKSLENHDQVSNNCVKFRFKDNYYSNLDKNNTCVDISIFIGNKRYRTQQICNPPKEFDLCNNVAKTGVRLTYRVSTYDIKDAQYSKGKYFSVVYKDKNDVPNVPAIVSLSSSVSQKEFNVSYTTNYEKIDAIAFTLYKKGGKKEYNKLIPQSGNKSGVKKSFKIAIDSPVKTGDTWCIKAKSVGINGKVSKYSIPICVDFEATSSNIDSMPWPAIKNRALELKPKKAYYDKYQKEMRINIARFVPRDRDFDVCEATGIINSLPSFIVYRQRVYDDGTKSKFLQVSSLIETVRADCDEQGGYITGSHNIKISTHIDEEGYVNIYFVDRYPYVEGGSYRYVILFFDPLTKEIASYALTTPDVVKLN